MLDIYELFREEHNALEDAQLAAADKSLSPEALRQALSTLSRHYQRLIRESGRLISRSDRAERELTQINNRLQTLTEQLEYEASHDPLTAVYNRSAIIRLINQALSTNPAALILLDIDHFKRINDEFGHPKGDEVICALIARIRDALPSCAHVGRVGGEEFTILLQGHETDQVAPVAHAIHQALNAAPLSVLPGRLVTVSIGVSWGERHSPFETLYHAADCALYLAKKQGRNRVALHTSLPG